MVDERICTGCGTPYPATAAYFYRRRRICKACKAARQRDWYRRNPQKRRQYNQAYRQRHREREREALRAWRAAHPDKVKAANARAYAKRKGG